MKTPVSYIKLLNIFSQGHFQLKKFYLNDLKTCQTDFTIYKEFSVLGSF